MKSATPAAPPAYSGMRSLSGVLEQQRVIRAARAASLTEAAEPEPEHLYSVGKDGVVVAYPVTRKTDKTIWYQRPGRMRWKFAWFDITLPDGTTGCEFRFTGDQEWDQPEPDSVQRQRLERDGVLCSCFSTGTVAYCHANYGGKTIPVTHYIYTTKEAAEAAAKGMQ